MKYKVNVSELRYGEAIVEAESEEEAKSMVGGVEVSYYDSEFTEITAEPYVEEEVTELCPNCDGEVTFNWNVNTMGFKAKCPDCGIDLMLCDECTLRGNSCDYDKDTGECRFSQNEC